MPRTQADTPASLARAKRLFMANLVLMAGLFAAAGIFFRSGHEDAAHASSAKELPPEKALSLPELAFLKGQIDALRAHPQTMPPFEETWARPISRKAILRDPAFAGQDKVSIESMADEYLRGYAGRFDEYFDPSIARNFGYKYGLRFDPEGRPLLGAEAVQAAILPHERMLRERYDLDLPEWQLFVEAFADGFESGYYQVKKDITVEARTPIPLDFE